MDRLLSATAHQVGFSKSGTASCSACKTMALPKVLKAWLKGPCCKQFSWRGGVQQPEAQELRVGSAVVHPSHKPLQHKGLWMCSKCGAYCSVATGRKCGAKLLVQPCRGKLQGGGRTFWSRFSRGLPPKPGMQWPDDP